MIAYWFLFCLVAIFAASEGQAAARQFAGHPQYQGSMEQRRPRRTALLFCTFVIIFFIGLRFQVGADWDAYVSMFLAAKRTTLGQALTLGDPSYQALNWLAGRLGGSVWIVNLSSGLIFGWGLYKFCSVQPKPYLALAVAVPYLVIVVAMGYTRQAIALGILMAGLSRQIKGASPLNFAVYCAVAASFHSSAVVLFPIIAWSSRGSPIINVALVVSIGFVLYKFFLSDKVDSLVANYIDTSYSSQGAFIRVSMNLLAAGAFYLGRKRMQFTSTEYSIWRNFSVVSVIMGISLAIVSSSTAIDRISLYLLPMQVALISRLPLMSTRGRGNELGVLAYLFLVQFVWLNFGQFSTWWIPYRVFPVMDAQHPATLFNHLSAVRAGHR